MAVLLLFASAREAAGTRRAEIAGDTVDQVLRTAADQYGQAFAAIVAHSQIWLNGAPAEPRSPVTAGDEVAVLPPVSGGGS